jgi:hypothetical protein
VPAALNASLPAARSQVQVNLSGRQKEATEAQRGEARRRTRAHDQTADAQNTRHKRRHIDQTKFHRTHKHPVFQRIKVIGQSSTPVPRAHLKRGTNLEARGAEIRLQIWPAYDVPGEVRVRVGESLVGSLNGVKGRHLTDTKSIGIDCKRNETTLSNDEERSLRFSSGFFSVLDGFCSNS